MRHLLLLLIWRIYRRIQTAKHAIQSPAEVVYLRKESIQIDLGLLSAQMHAVYARKLAIQNALHSALDISQSLSSTRGLILESKSEKLSLLPSLLSSLPLSLLLSVPLKLQLR